MEKHNTLDLNFQPENLDDLIANFNSELQKMEVESLQKTHKKLNFLCLNLDPYNCEHITIESENILNEYRLMHLLTNPFNFTNIILRMLNLTEEALKKRMN